MYMVSFKKQLKKRYERKIYPKKEKRNAIRQLKRLNGRKSLCILELQFVDYLGKYRNQLQQNHSGYQLLKSSKIIWKELY